MFDMPLQNFFKDRLKKIKEFLASSGPSMLVLEHEPDMKRILMRVVLSLEENPNLSHIIVVSDIAFHTAEQYCRELLIDIHKQNEVFRDDLSNLGVLLPEADLNEHANLDEDSKRFWSGRFIRYVSELTECLPDFGGSYTIFLDPKIIEDEDAFAEQMACFAKDAAPVRLKYLVPDRCQDGILSQLIEENQRVERLFFHLPMEDVEKEVKQDLKDGKLNAEDVRQYTAMAAAFAFARKEYGEAEQLQKNVLEMAEQDGATTDAANALYSLGNTALAKDELDQAEIYFCKAADISLDRDMSALTALVMTNLGVTLYRKEQPEAALESFSVAQRTFRAMKNLPGEAHVLDCMAGVFAARQQNQEAERSWLQARDLYAGITNEVFRDIREAGTIDILQKLEDFYQKTGQTDKIYGLRQQES
jgi:tetratricopeptide (TPR) repeat protein